MYRFNNIINNRYFLKRRAVPPSVSVTHWTERDNYFADLSSVRLNSPWGEIQGGISSLEEAKNFLTPSSVPIFTHGNPKKRVKSLDRFSMSHIIF